MRRAYKIGAGVAAGAVFLGFGAAEHQSGYELGTTDTAKQVEQAKKQGAEDCLNGLDWRSLGSMTLTAAQVHDVETAGVNAAKKIEDEPRGATIIAALGKGGLERVIISGYHAPSELATPTDITALYNQESSLQKGLEDAAGRPPNSDSLIFDLNLNSDQVIAAPDGVTVEVKQAVCIPTTPDPTK